MIRLNSTDYFIEYNIMLRKYSKNTKQEKLYSEMYQNQLYDYVIQQNNKYSKLNNRRMTIKEA